MLRTGVIDFTKSGSGTWLLRSVASYSVNRNTIVCNKELPLSKNYDQDFVYACFHPELNRINKYLVLFRPVGVFEIHILQLNPTRAYKYT